MVLVNTLWQSLPECRYIISAAVLGMLSVVSPCVSVGGKVIAVAILSGCCVLSTIGTLPYGQRDGGIFLWGFPRAPLNYLRPAFRNSCLP